MDPNANLAEQLQIAARIIAGGMYPTDLEEDSVRLAELVDALNGWIVAGGFLPAAWGRGRS